MFYKDQILSSPADVTFERTKLTVMFFCGTENLALSYLSIIYLFADSTVQYIFLSKIAEMGVRSWFRVPAFLRSRHFRNEGARKHKCYTGMQNAKG